LEYPLYVFIAALGILFRYNLGLSQACKVIGQSISDTDSATGFQDAITPPKSSNITLLTWVAIAAALGYAVYQFGWESGSIALAVFFLVSMLAGAVLIPTPESPHYIKRIYSSMANRYANFNKSGDTIRADAMKVLIDKVESRYGEHLKG